MLALWRVLVSQCQRRRRKLPLLIADIAGQRFFLAFLKLYSLRYKVHDTLWVGINETGISPQGQHWGQS